jgi:DNA-binding response OmpR family regulator
MPSALVVEDDEVIGRIMTEGLEELGHDVTWCVSGALALRAAAVVTPDVCIVDLGLPDADGLELVRSLRLTHPAAIVVVATARGEAIDVVAGLDAGADDYIVKPFTMIEIAARLRAIARRRTDPADPVGASDAAPTAVGPLLVDVDRRTAVVGGVAARLREREYRLLELLARSAGRPVSRHVVLRELWPDSGRSAQKSLNVTLTTLRAKLADAAATAGVPAPVITTLHSFGYRLETGGGALPPP